MTFVLDQSLTQAAVSTNHIYQIINNPVLKSKDNIQIAQTDIRINHYNLSAKHGKTCSNVSDSGGFSHSAFPGSNYNGFTHSLFSS